ncbi:hypothetical protein TW95_gp0153 [Pandoravirus inopinatum]|uniref:Uncharacterized protein n=1 Tax=Pandoravirus inopinatum TaxID=1605721 RepID=A0A0B5JBE6_9VIRU|nr:hypothetical protein TW95_gp0153 [Pandoravirus inopinatum]AJF96887.1 hypothetical protein [Pandoravirus inopinatum]
MRSLDSVRPRPWSAGWMWMGALATVTGVLGAGTWLALVMAGTAVAARAGPVECRPCTEIASTPAGLVLSGAVIGFVTCALVMPLRSARHDVQTEGIVRVATAAA